MGKVLGIACLAVAVALMGGGYYLNHYTPRGPMYETGDVVCGNDDRGPCMEERREDMSALALPDWQKDVKAYGPILGILLAALGSGLIANSRLKPDSH